MTIHQIITAQYRAALQMLNAAVEACPPEMWDNPADQNRFWHVTYHALFYLHLYLQVNEGAFQPWEKHRPEYQFMGSVPWPPHHVPTITTVYSSAEILSYLSWIYDGLPAMVDKLDLAAPSGFDWLPMSKLELQFYNLRHLQQHTGELCERLGAQGVTEIGWVGSDRKHGKP